MERVTTSGKPPIAGTEDLPAPGPINPATGQHTEYWVLSEAERAKGFVRPVRDTYRHVGRAEPKFPLRDLTAEELERWGDDPPFAKFEAYPPNYKGSAVGRYWTQEELDSIGKGCGTATTMSRAIAETYARSPHFYGKTFCCACRTHLPVGQDGEFIWEDGSRVGT